MYAILLDFYDMHNKESKPLIFYKQKNLLKVKKALDMYLDNPAKLFKLVAGNRYTDNMRIQNIEVVTIN